MGSANAATSREIMKNEGFQGLNAAEASRTGRNAVIERDEASRRYRLLATMVQGTAASLPQAWQSYRNLDEARIAARETLHNHRVLRVAIVEDRMPLQFVEWIGR